MLQHRSRHNRVDSTTPEGKALHDVGYDLPVDITVGLQLLLRDVHRDDPGPGPVVHNLGKLTSLAATNIQHDGSFRNIVQMIGHCAEIPITQLGMSVRQERPEGSAGFPVESEELSQQCSCRAHSHPSATVATKYFEALPVPGQSGR